MDPIDQSGARSVPGFESAQLEYFMQAYSYAFGLAEAGDVAAGLRLLHSHLEELRRRSDTTPAGVIDLWEIGLVRYEDQFPALPQTTKRPEDG